MADADRNGSWTELGLVRERSTGELFRVQEDFQNGALRLVRARFGWDPPGVGELYEKDGVLVVQLARGGGGNGVRAVRA